MRRGNPRRGEFRCGKAWQGWRSNQAVARRGWLRRGKFRCGKAGQILGEAIEARIALVGNGTHRRGNPRRGVVRQGNIKYRNIR